MFASGLVPQHCVWIRRPSADPTSPRNGGRGLTADLFGILSSFTHLVYSWTHSGNWTGQKGTRQRLCKKRSAGAIINTRKGILSGSSAAVLYLYSSLRPTPHVNTNSDCWNRWRLPDEFYYIQHLATRATWLMNGRVVFLVWKARIDIFFDEQPKIVNYQLGKYQIRPDESRPFH